ncbi:MAG: FtsK/SpoIIIE domain-containing protein [Pirellulaceae bacterium]
MKDSSVDPPGLFDPRRQKRLLSGLAQRCRSSAEQQLGLLQRHHAEKNKEEQSLASSRSEQTDECRRQRREMLQDWDAAEEKLTSTYEATAIKTRQQISRLSAIYRKQLAEGQQDIARKVEARREAVVHQYETRKNQPIEQRQTEIAQIDDSLTPMQDDIEWARALTVRRLDGLPPVPPAETPEENMAEIPPKSVSESVDTVFRLTRKLKSTVLEMQTGAASKIVDSFYLPAGVAVFIVIWIVGVLALQFESPWIPMLVGIVTGGVLGFIIYAILLWPLKKMTRVLYPRVERIVVAAEEVAQTGRNIATKTAKELSQELIDRRDSHLATADRWKKEQLAELEIRLKEEQRESRDKLTLALKEVDEKYLADYADISGKMHQRAESLAIEITDALSQTDKQLEEQRKASQVYRKEQLQRLAHRLKQGVHKGMQRIAATETSVTQRFPDWQSIATADSAPPDQLDYLPLGTLGIADNLRASLSPAAQANPDGVINSQSDTPAIVPDDEIPGSLPVVLHRRLHSGVVISAASSQMENAIDLAHQILWRLLSGVKASRAKLTLIDPLGRGQHFTSFMALADHDPSLVGHRVWASESNIDQRLGEIAHHIEDVLQSSLRDRFERIEDYNLLAGSMAEPYRIIAGVGLPEGLTRSSYKHLLALIQSGLRCGVFTVIVTDSTKAWPADMPLPSGEKLLKLNVDESGKWQFESELLDALPFEPAPSPPAALRNQLVEKIGTAAIAASKVEIPLRTLLNKDKEGEASTDDGIEIVIGTQGANRSLALDLGEGVRQHVLIAGKTGSGKSTLLHSIITSGAFHYRPDQLHFYLLDFKKGVEFKPYADNGMPHARVIGIESEREFGRSVLQRLDAELQSRGEKFRAYGVQELSEYRGTRGDEMPRIMLVVDEFQELFVRDDRLAGDCAMLLDRLVRQGRSFGMHVVLSSQSLAGAFSLPRATLGQMAVRIAMHCSESDAALILSDDNTAARLISRPGEAIYNDAGGLVEGNQPFQVAWLSSDDHKQLLARIANRDDKFIANYAPPVIFEGNRPCAWSGPLADLAINGEKKTNALRGFLGESVEIGPPATLELTRNAGRNVLLITPPESRGAIIASTVSSYAKSHRKLQILYFDGNRADDSPSLMPWLEEAKVNAKQIKPRDAEAEMVALNKIVQQRGEENEKAAPIVAIIDPLDRFREFRQDESFSFSLDSAAADENGATALRDVLRDGPAANVFVYLVCGGAETLSRWLPRASQHDLELRILGRMNASDSSVLIDSPIASELSAATMLLYDDSEGRIMKFRQCDLPDAETVSRWLAK